MQRFDEMELESLPAIEDESIPEDGEGLAEATRTSRLLALLTDLSLFGAFALALSPLLPAGPSRIAIASLAGFVVVVSYYYFVGSWLLWGKTVGGAIFDVRVVASTELPAMALRNATLRWAGIYLSLLTLGVGFLLAALPSRRSLPDWLSATSCVAG
jgi:hypothetical protein